MLQDLYERDMQLLCHQHSTFQHKHITMPTAIPEDMVTAAAIQWTQALQHTTMVQISEITKQVLQRLSNLFVRCGTL